ncbi:hypothetical protein DTL42_08030 [Bremerella cremea]|uniref:Uncharacterized protein n=1 Tax=Bremerella cremea TaxID=1031537 RepID=A0A368KV41_9BACT|nr:hypothetical protein DTL42_08030 [Bremerella cremea]
MKWLGKSRKVGGIFWGEIPELPISTQHDDLLLGSDDWRCLDRFVLQIELNHDWVGLPLSQDIRGKKCGVNDHKQKG